MKRIYIVFITVVLFSTILTAQWEKVSDINIGVTGSIVEHNNSIFAYGTDQGFKFFRFSSGGSEVTDLASNVPDDFQALYSFNGNLYASSIRTIYKSVDDGNSWEQVAELEFENNNGAIRGFTSHGGELYAYSNRKYIFRSTANDTNWEEIVIQDASDIQLLDFSATSEALISVITGEGAGVSADNGQSWNANNSAPAITSVYNFNGKHYGATYNGIFRFNTSSITWDAVNNGLPDDGAFQIVKSIYGTGNSMYIGVTELLTGISKIYFSDDEGDNWSEVTLESLPTVNAEGSTEFIASDDHYLYYYYYGLLDGENTGLYKFAHDGVTSVEDKNTSIADSYKLNQNYPNPFNPSTTISFSLPESKRTELVIFNSLGERVDELINEILPAGNHAFKFEADSNLSSGIYFYRLTIRSFVQSGKMMLLK